MKDYVEIGHLTKYDSFWMNRDQVMDLKTWFKIHTNVFNFETASPKIISATSLNNETSEADKRKVESGQYSIVYGSLESWLGDTRWRKILSSETCKNSVRVMAMDEAHVICHR